MYEGSEIVALGAAHELILGVKPMGGFDWEGLPNFDERQTDMDEVDE